MSIRRVNRALQIDTSIYYYRPRRRGQALLEMPTRLDLGAHRHGVALDVFRPRKPTENAFIQAFNEQFQAECLNGSGS